MSTSMYTMAEGGRGGFKGEFRALRLECALFGWPLLHHFLPPGVPHSVRCKVLVEVGMGLGREERIGVAGSRVVYVAAAFGPQAAIMCEYRPRGLWMGIMVVS